MADDKKTYEEMTPAEAGAAMADNVFKSAFADFHRRKALPPIPAEVDAVPSLMADQLLSNLPHKAGITDKTELFSKIDEIADLTRKVFKGMDSDGNGTVTKTEVQGLPNRDVSHYIDYNNYSRTNNGDMTLDDINAQIDKTVLELKTALSVKDSVTGQDAFMAAYAILNQHRDKAHEAAKNSNPQR